MVSFSSLSLWFFILGVVGVDGHGFMTKPTPRYQTSTGTLADYQQREPTPYGEAFVCRNTLEQTEKTPLTAGGSLTVQWGFTASHVGDCFMYISYDVNKPDLEKKWFKIANLPACNQQNFQDVEVTIPSFLPSADHAILRWEWYALHVSPTVEFYAQCVDVSIAGDNSFGVPKPAVLVPGHLPSNNNNGDYRDGFTPGAPFFLTGPELATAVDSDGTPVTDDGGAAGDDGGAAGDDGGAAGDDGGAPAGDDGADSGDGTLTQCNRYPADPYDTTGDIDESSGTCGPSTGNRCANGHCCSEFGSCGDTDEYCNDNSLGDWRVNEACEDWDTSASSETCWCTTDVDPNNTGGNDSGGDDDKYLVPFVVMLIAAVMFGASTVYLFTSRGSTSKPASTARAAQMV